MLFQQTFWQFARTFGDVENYFGHVNFYSASIHNPHFFSAVWQQLNTLLYFPHLYLKFTSGRASIFRSGNLCSDDLVPVRIVFNIATPKTPNTNVHDFCQKWTSFLHIDSSIMCTHIKIYCIAQVIRLSRCFVRDAERTTRRAQIMGFGETVAISIYYHMVCLVSAPVSCPQVPRSARDRRSRADLGTRGMILGLIPSKPCYSMFITYYSLNRNYGGIHLMNCN